MTKKKESKLFDGKTILVTGGTGSFGSRFIEYVLSRYRVKKLIIYSRDEHKQYQLGDKFSYFDNVRYFIGNVRDKKRLSMACNKVDCIIHTAALKHVHVCEYNPFEAAKTNIYGAQNVIEVAIERGVKKVIALSTDKAVNPVSLYGATKLVSDKLFIAANTYSEDTIFSVVRCGNIAGSRGSVVPYFRNLVKEKKELPIRNKEMTRFWITNEEIIKIISIALERSQGGEIFIPKMDSFKVVDLATAISPDSKQKEVGIRKGEKIHERLITKNDSLFYVYKFSTYFIIYPNKPINIEGTQVKKDFRYDSQTGNVSIDDLKSKLHYMDTKGL